MRTNFELCNLDLSPVAARIKQELGWSESRLERAAQQYRAFLANADVSDEVPLESDADEFWHYHILDTRKYQQDCRTMFNGYLHHVPASAGSSKCSKMLERAAG